MKLISNILVIRTDRLGDLLMNVPLIRRLRLSFPKARITLLCDTVYREVLSRQPDLDDIIPVEVSALNTLEGKRRLFLTLREKRFDAVIVSNPGKFFHAMSMALGARVRVGLGRKFGFFLNRAIPDLKAESLKHEIDYNLELVDDVCSEPWDGQISLGFNRNSENENPFKTFGLAEDSKTVAVHMTTTNVKKQWPVERFAGVIKTLVEDRDLQVLALGDGSNRELLQRLGLEREVRFRDLIGKTSLLELASLLGRVHCLLSLDSGPYHLAWMQKVPVVGIFLKECPGSNPTRWGVYPGFVKSRQIYERSDEITEDEVVAAVYECLGRTTRI